MQAAIPDVLRLVAVPLLGWAAVRDVRTRRVPNEVWWPLAVLGLGLVAWELAQLWNGQFGFRLYVLRLGLSVGIVVPLAYAFWYIGGFGGADAKAFMVLALLFPTYPTYELLGQTFPMVVTDLGVFSLSVLTNTVLVGLVFPVVLGIGNLLQGQFSWVMFLGHRVPVGELPRRHGTLLESPDGLTTSGLDLDALRMYLRWRGLDLATVRSNPGLADPETLPAEPNDPTDGAVSTDGKGPTAEEPALETDGGGDRRADLEEWEWTDVEGHRATAGDPDGTADEPAETEAGSDGPGTRPATSEADSDATEGPSEEREAEPEADRWGAATFLEDIDSSAYGTTPEALRDGLDVVVESESVWVSPGVPFIVPTFVGLIVALTAGDILFMALQAVGLVGP